MASTFVNMSSKQTDYLVIGAGAMGLAFADEIFHLSPKAKITIVDRRSQVGGHWVDAYPFVRLHQPAAFYGVNSKKLGNDTADLSSKSEILTYYKQVQSKLENSGQVEFLLEYEYKGDGQVVSLKDPSKGLRYQVHRRIVDASYMNVEVPSTHPPKFEVDEGVHLVPLNSLVSEYDQWEHFCVIGNGKTGMDAVLFLLEKGVHEDQIQWICPHQAWFFNRPALQVGKVAKEILAHAREMLSASTVDDIFLAMEKSTGGITRLDTSTLPDKWRCATINPQEIAELRKIKQIINKGRVDKITTDTIQLREGEVAYAENTLFVNCTADGLAKRPSVPIFSDGKITMQSILFCQQVFSAATIAKLELSNLSDKQKNRVIPLPHPEYKEDWPALLSEGVDNLLTLHKFFPLWMFRSRLNFMSHEPILSYFYYSGQAMSLGAKLKKAKARFSPT